MKYKYFAFFYFLFGPKTKHTQADDGVYSTVCNVNVTIRDVNNNAPQFLRDNYMASIVENTPIGEYANPTRFPIFSELKSAVS